MSTQAAIRAYLDSLPEARRADMEALHKLILGLKAKLKLWYMDGKDKTGKVVANPSIGYGALKSRDFYQVGISANTSGMTVYLMGIDDRNYLKDTYGADIGKAALTGYCIKLKRLSDVDLPTLKRAIKDGLSRA